MSVGSLSTILSTVNLVWQSHASFPSLSPPELVPCMAKFKGGQNDDFRPLTHTLGGRAWGAGTNMWHPETLASYESLPAPLATQIPILWIHTSGRGGGGGGVDNRSMSSIRPICKCRCPPLAKFLPECPGCSFPGGSASAGQLTDWQAPGCSPPAQGQNLLLWVPQASIDDISEYWMIL